MQISVMQLGRGKRWTTLSQLGVMLRFSIEVHVSE
jgi:hypothetical protein